MAKDGTPNFKSVHFTIDFDGVGNVISYRYTTNVAGDVWKSVGPVIVTGSTFISNCMELPLEKSSTYAEAFDIEIDVNGIHTYTFHFRKP